MFVMSCPTFSLAGDTISEMEAKLRARGFDVQRVPAAAAARAPAAPVRRPAVSPRNVRPAGGGPVVSRPAPVPSTARGELAALLRRALVAYQAAAARR